MAYPVALVAVELAVVPVVALEQEQQLDSQQDVRGSITCNLRPGNVAPAIVLCCGIT